MEDSEEQKPAEQQPVAEKAEEHVEHKVHHKVHKKPVEHKPKSDLDEEVSIDFSGIKNFFKGFKSKEKKHVEKHVEIKHEKDEEISIDINKAKELFLKYYPVLLLLIPLILAITVRMESDKLSMTDDWARNSVYNYYQMQIKAQVNSQYPNMPDANKNQVVTEQFAEFLKTNKDQIEQQIPQLSSQYKSYFQDENGYRYMPDIDSYFYLRYARNIVETGHPYDKLENGTVPWDNHMVAPLGSSYQASIHPYFLAFLYKLTSAFNSKITLMQAAGYYPVILAALAILPAFFIGRRLTNNVGGFFAAMMIALNQAFLGRSLFGHGDTDAYAIFFPLFIIWFFLEAFEAKDMKWKISLSALAGLFTGLFSFAWGGWWYVFDFAVGAAVIYIAYLVFSSYRKKIHIMKSPAVINSGIVLLTFIVISGIFVTMFTSFTSFLNAPIGPFAFTSIKNAALESLWPNVYTTVAELNEGSFSQIISGIGGIGFFLISVAGIVFAFFRRDEHGHLDIKYAALLVLWYVGIFYATLKGIRFLEMLVPPFAIAFGCALGMIFMWVTDFMHKSFDIKKNIGGVIIFVLMALLMIAPLSSAYAAAKQDIPIVNDPWWNALTKIKNESKSDAIINSWWDFGHHFKYISDRAVTFDGATQFTAAHWVGLALLTDNENLSRGILHMLDCGSETAFNVLDKDVNDASESVKMLYAIVVMDRDSARKYLIDRKISEKTADEVLKNTHCNAPEDYFITSEDMVGKAGVWAHFGSWDFDRADMWVQARKMNAEQGISFIMKNANKSKSEAEKLYYEVQTLKDEQEANSWIASWPSYVTGLMPCSANNQTLVCQNVRINLADMDTTAQTQQGTFKPASLTYLYNGTFKEKIFNTTFPYAVSLINKDGNYYAIMMQTPLQNSIFNRLYFYEGAGINNFDKFDYQRGITGTEIYTWKVRW